MHRYIVGQSGTGKSTLLLQIILQTPAFCLLDPHGDLAEAVADRLDCIYFDPTEVPIGLNVLKHVPPAKRHLVAHNVISSFKTIWGDSWGPRMEQILYQSLRVLLDNNAAVTDLPQLLTDRSYRVRCLRRASLQDFWRGQFDQWDDRQRNEYIQPVLNKAGQLAGDPVLTKVLGANFCLPLTKLMNTGRKVVVNLSKSKLGDSPSRLLGALLVNALYQSSQVSKRRPFVVIADEFQNFATDTFATILSEARKFGMSLVLAHQLLDQIDVPLRAAVLGNVGSIDCFRVSPVDARALAPAMGINNPEILSDLANFEYWQNMAHPPRPIHNHTRPAPSTGGILGRNQQRVGHWYGQTKIGERRG